MSDWREPLLKRLSFPGYDRIGRNPTAWAGYEPRAAVRHALGELGGHKFVACVWDFDVYGGSLSEIDATTFVEAVDHAIRYREPLVSLVRSGGVRLQEGVAALAGMVRIQLAL
ncbi:MAG: carboxyl transferase domain-containing protein, partial [Mycobacteriales bacterium]|nr:acetyl-CoA carboxylase subunit alpha/beta [Frankia sp.]